MGPEDSRNRDIASEDPVELLLFVALEGPESSWGARVDHACREHPEHADALRRRFARLGALGLDRSPPADTRDGDAPAATLDSAHGRGGRTPDRVGDFELIRPLGSGGMGVVHLARQRSLGRLVALKLLHGVEFASSQARQRFRREMEAASRLDHPGLCTVYEAGEAEGIPYIAMRYVEGESLAQWIERRRSSHTGRVRGDEDSAVFRERMDQAIALIESLARSLHAAHEAGLVHRDIKPGNLQVARSGEPVVLDFGLARVEGSELGTLTLSGASLGTPAYMAPEQLDGGARTVDRRADVYSLGVTLFEAVTLERPFQAPTREELYRSILTSNPEMPRSARQLVGRDLRVILETALEKEPQRRYQSALDLAEDLLRLRRREPILARPPGRLHRTRRWVQRHPFRAALLAVLVLGLAATSLLLGKLLEERAGKSAALRRARVAALTNASAKELRTDPMLALLVAREAWRHEDTAATRSQVVAALAELHELEQLPFDGWVGSVDLSPSGDRMLVGAFDRNAYLLDGAGLRIATLGPHAGQLLLVRFSPRGDRILTVPKVGPGYLWDAEGKRIAELAGPRGILVGGSYQESNAATFSPRGDHLCLGGAEGVTRLFTPDGHVRASVGEPGEYAVLAVAVSDLASRFAAGRGDGLVLVGTFTGEELLRFDQGSTVLALALSPDGRWLASGARDGSCRLTDLEDGSWVELEGHRSQVNDLLFAPDGALLASASEDRSVRLWNTRGELEHVFEGFRASVVQLAFSADGERLAAGSNDGTARVHDRNGHLIALLRGHRDRVSSIRFSADGERVLTGSLDETARLWSVQAPGIPSLPPHAAAVTQAIFSPDGERLLTVDIAGGARVSAGTERIADMTLHRSVRSAAWTPDGTRFLLGVREGWVSLWSDQGERLDTQRTGTGEVLGISLFPGGERALVSEPSRDEAMRILELGGDSFEMLEPIQVGKLTAGALVLADGRRIVSLELDGVRLRTLEGRLLGELALTGVIGAAASPDGRTVAVGLHDGSLLLLDVDGDRPSERLRIEAHARAVYGVDFSPDGQLLATGSKDGTAKLWSVDGAALLTLPQGGIVWTVDFSPDGTRLATSSSTGTVRTWPVHWEAWSRLAAERTPRELTVRERAQYAELLEE